MSDWESRYRTRTDKFINGYWPLYLQLTETLPEAPAILELGVAYGGSLALWQEMYPNGVIAGVDNDHEFPAQWPAGTHAIRAGQDDPRGVQEASQLAPDGYDLVVDDASHIASLSRASLELYWPLVKPGGWYVYEDWGLGSEDSAFYGEKYGMGEPLALAQDFLRKIARKDHSGIDEIRARHSILAARKRNPGEPLRYLAGCCWNTSGELMFPGGTTLVK